MSNSRKIQLGLAITGVVLVLLTFVLFLAKKAAVLDFETQVGGIQFASLITLGFGGEWLSTMSSSFARTGNALLAISFIFVIIALILSVVILIGFITKKFLPKTNLILCMVAVGLMLFATTVVCCTKAIAINILAKDPSVAIEIIKNYVRVTGNVIACAVVGFVSIACYTVFAVYPYAKQKIAK